MAGFQNRHDVPETAIKRRGNSVYYPDQLDGFFGYFARMESMIDEMSEIGDVTMNTACAASEGMYLEVECLLAGRRRAQGAAQ